MLEMDVGDSLCRNLVSDVSDRFEMTDFLYCHDDCVVKTVNWSTLVIKEWFILNESFTWSSEKFTFSLKYKRIFLIGNQVNHSKTLEWFDAHSLDGFQPHLHCNPDYLVHRYPILSKIVDLHPLPRKNPRLQYH